MGSRVRIGFLVMLGLMLGLLVSACSMGGSTTDAGSTSESSASSGAAATSEEHLLTEDGWGDIQLGASEAVVRDVLGKSDSQQEFPEMNGQPAAVFYDYVDDGIQVSFVKPQMTVNALFFFGGTGDHADFTRFAAGTDKGITWASTPEDVIAAYGDPVNDYMSDDGGLEWRRLAYSDMSFRFQNGVLETIAVGAD